ncbi:putative FAD dependent oxidoreductase [Xylogone sp. PMI_703]|nr:putative FAD dependent oxidoreductase [Xylogone sp. PMI_703]
MDRKIGIIGAGITGLATALVLCPDYDITIVARDLPGDLGTNWASPWAGAVFHPQQTISKAVQEMQTASFKFYWSLAQQDSSAGVKVYPMTEFFDNPIKDSEVWYKTLMPEFRYLDSKDLPPETAAGVKYKSLGINPIFFLPWIKKQLDAKGVKFIRKEISSIEEARKLTGARVIVNASGVGAKSLAGDEEVKPVRGQTMFVKTDFEELFIREGREYTYVIPRSGSGGVIMGGIKSDRLDTEVDVELKSDILKRTNRMTGGAFKAIDVSSVTDIVGFRPGRTSGLRVERERDVIHAYGAGGAGYIYSFGVAERVKALLKGITENARL